MIKFGLRIPPCEPAPEVSDLVVRAEAGGFDYAWLPDSQLLWRDVWVTLAVAGSRTSKIILGTNVTNPLTRHSTVAASAAVTLDELTDGRFVLGIGSGDSSVRVMGWKTAKIAQLREYITLMRALWDGRVVAPYGPSVRLQYSQRRRIRVYVSATGPNMLQFAGEVADGVILLAGIAPESLEYSLRNIEIGARRGGRKIEDIDIATGTFCTISDDWRTTMKVAQPYAALFAVRHPDALRDAGVEVPPVEGIAGIYPDLSHAEDWDRAIEVTDWVPAEVLAAFCERFCLMGTADDVAAKVRTLESYGVNNLYIRGFYSYSLPTEVCEAFSSKIIPLFKGPTPVSLS
jgi:5,10-methylenetetrahydromethanopterin reductase